jgi:methionyl-tRNA formyltransferase
MDITVLSSDPKHPVRPWLERWQARQVDAGHTVRIVQHKSELDAGDLLFLISCHEVIRKNDRDRFGLSLVVHASDLPDGRGWSPHVWQIAAGAHEMVVTLLEAAEGVDKGRIVAKQRVQLEGHELCDEIHQRLFDCEVALMDYAVIHYGSLTLHPQDESRATYFRKRTPEDSRLDPHASIAEQFNLLRVADPERYPAFFDYRGHRYVVKLQKVSQ